MSTIVTRAGKGYPLTWDEMDNNLNNLNYGSYVSVKDSAYGAKGDGVTDDTAAIQSAINSLSAGGALYFPPGLYPITQINITTNKITLFGSGNASKLLSVDSTSTLITSSGSEVTIDSMAFSTQSGTVRTGGTYINASGYETLITNCKFLYGYTAIYIGPANSIVSIVNCNFSHFNTNGASDIIIIDTTGAATIINDCVFDNLANLMPRSGIRVNSTQDLTISNCNVIHCGKDLYVIPPNGKTVASIYAQNTFFDTATNGIYIAPSTGGYVDRCQFLNCWTSSHTDRGTTVDGSLGTIRGICFTNLASHLNGSDGIIIQGPNISDVVFNGGECSQNVGSGFTCSTDATSFYVRNLHSGSGHGLTGNAWGIYLNSGATNYEISGCVLEGNTTGQFADLAKTGRVFRNYNTTGVKTYNSGNGVITIGNSAVSINHGLNTTPAVSDITITAHTTYANNWLSVNVASVDPTSFIVLSHIVVAGYDFNFSWTASCQSDH